MGPEDSKQMISWKEWSKETFDFAAKERKLVLLDLTASWCHWCHVMDQTTYSDPDIIQTINAMFVPVRVDIDKRPDISERYNRGGFPTTAFLSDRGESIWGATYIPISDMKRIINSIIDASQSGEIGDALERSRMHFLDVSAATEPRAPLSLSETEDVFEDIFATYDVENGGFGIAPKFPHPAILDMLMAKHAAENERELADAVVNTLRKMSEGLYDHVEGGLFRYSVSGDWRFPHYEKLLDTNLGYLNNLVHANAVFGNKDFEEWAGGTAEYLLRTLRDEKSGGFFGSQDADEEYYRLDARERKGRKAPDLDRTIYAGWNSEAVSVLVNAGRLLGNDEIANAGAEAWRFVLDRLWDKEKGLARHSDSQELSLFEDQVALLSAALAMLDVAGNDEPIRVAESLIKGVDAAFAHEDGGYGDVEKVQGAVGELEDPRRPLAENAAWARALALFGVATHREDLVEKARSILMSFTKKEVDSSGLFAATYVLARWTLERGPICVEVHSDARGGSQAADLARAAGTNFDPGIMVRSLKDPEAKEPYAVICTSAGCQSKIEDPDKLSAALASAVPSKGH
jgi:uncharacterized protein YyaL (SSP411 family)